mgnify:CR=1 FL=1
MVHLVAREGFLSSARRAAGRARRCAPGQVRAGPRRVDSGPNNARCSAVGAAQRSCILHRPRRRRRDVSPGRLRRLPPRWRRPCLPCEVVASPREVLLAPARRSCRSARPHHFARSLVAGVIASIADCNRRDHRGEPVYLIGPSLAQLSAERIAGVFGPGEPYLADLQLPRLRGSRARRRTASSDQRRRRRGRSAHA